MSTKELLRLRAQYLQSLRAFFQDSGYTEVETPLLSPYLLPEPSLEVFKTRFLAPEGSDRELYLIPSPELWMKRLIAQGAGSIFQITKCFRNMEPLAATHHPEFTMLEWYTPDYTYLDSIAIVENLLAFVCHELDIASPIRFDSQQVDMRPPFSRLSLREAFWEYARIDLDQFLTNRAGQDESVASDTPEQRFNRAFLLQIEPNLPKDRPLILHDFPLAVPTFAKQVQDGSSYCQRWELYIGGLEIANCYTEEHDPRVLSERFKQEAHRKQGCFVGHRIDTDFPELFSPESPDFSGVALGVDRLLMALSGTSSIDGVIFFPFQSIL